MLRKIDKKDYLGKANGGVIENEYGNVYSYTNNMHVKTFTTDLKEALSYDINTKFFHKKMIYDKNKPGTKLYWAENGEYSGYVEDPYYEYYYYGMSSSDEE